MKTNRHNNHTPLTLKELGRRALVVLLTLSMVSMNSPLAYAAEVGEQDANVTAQSETPDAQPSAQTQSDSQETPAPAQNEQESQATTEEPAIEPDQGTEQTGDEAKDDESKTNEAKDEANKDEVKAGEIVPEIVEGTQSDKREVEIALSFEHAYIHYKGQTVGFPTKSISITGGRPFEFVANADDGCVLEEVKTTLDDVETILEPNEHGTYVVPGELVTEGLLITVTAKTDPFAADSKTLPIEEKRNEQKTFVFENDDIKVTAELTDPSALPADVAFEVKPITKDSKDEQGNPAYNYDAYMEALNNNARTGVEYTEDNTLLYDVGFFTAKKDQDGKAIADERVEVPLAEGQVKLDFQFKHQQLSEGIDGDKAQTIEVNHLPLKDSVRSGVDTTADATNIKANDIIVDRPIDQDANVAAENVQVSLDSLCVVGVTGLTNNEQNVIGQKAYPVTVSFTDEDGNGTTADFDLSKYKIYVKGYVDHGSWKEPKQVLLDLENSDEDKTYSIKLSDTEPFTIDFACIAEVHNPNVGAYDDFFASYTGNIKLSEGYFSEDYSTKGWRYTSEDTGDSFRADFAKQAAGQQTVITKFVKDDGEQLLDAMDPELTKDVYAIATFRLKGNSNGDVLGWARQVLSKDVINRDRQATVQFDTITRQNGGSMPFYPNLYDIEVTLYTKPNGEVTSLDDAVNNADRFIPGYDFIYNKKLQDDPTTTLIKLEQPKSKSLTINVKTDEDVTINGGDNYYLFIKLDHRTTEDSYQLLKINPSTGQTQTLEIANDWYDKSNNAKNDVFNGYETLKLEILESSSSNLTLRDVVGWDGNVADSSNYKRLGLQQHGNITAEYGVISSKVTGDHKSYTQTVRLRNFAEPAAQDGVDLESVLGNARYFGYVGNTWYVNNDAETNVAIKTIAVPGHQSGIQSGGKVAYDDGSNKQPWYVGSVEGYGRQMIKSDKAVLYAPLEARQHIYHEGEVNRAYDGSTSLIEYHEMSQEDVNAYIDSMIDHVKAQSAAMLGRSTIRGGLASMMNSQKIYLDITDRGPGTVYVSLDEPVNGTQSLMDYVFGNDCKLIITKRSDQVLVFNSAQENVQLGKYEITNKCYDKDGKHTKDVTTASDSMLNGASQDIEDITKTIIFNLPNAKTVKTMMSVAGIVICPQAYINVSSTSAGWLVADSINNTSGEWHSIWMHYNQNYDKDVAKIEATKQLNGAQPGDHRFNFELREGDRVVQTATNNAAGKVAFNLSYSTAGTHTYTIVEVQDGQSGITYDQSPAREVTVTIDQDMNATVAYPNGQPPVFNNTTSDSQTGELTISKTLANPQQGDQDKEFRFTVRLTNPVTSGTFDVKDSDEKIAFDANGTSATITLKGGQSKTITGLPTGVAYTVTEEVDDDFTSAANGDSGTISTGNATASFTNTRKQLGGLKVQKIVKENGNTPKTAYAKAKLAGTYTFKIYTDAECKNPAVDNNGEKRTVRLTIGNDGNPVTSAEVTNLQAGDYWVKEDNPNNGTTGYQTPVHVTVEANKTGDKAVIATITNNVAYETSGLEVKKVVSNPIGDDTSKEFAFKVTLTSNPAISGTYDGMTFTNNVAEFTLTHNQTKTATGLPAGTQYQVEEVLTNEQKLVFNDVAAETGTTSSGANAVAQFTNTRKAGDITIAKSVVSPVLGDKTSNYQFTIQLKDGQDDLDLDGTFKTQGGEDVKFEGGRATVDVAGTGSTKVVGLPAGVGYVVTEVAADNFTNEVTAGHATGTIEAGKTASVTFKNTRKTGDITIAKSVVSEDAADNQNTYKFMLQLTTSGINGEFETSVPNKKIKFENSIAYPEVTGSEQITIKGLPVGIGYNVSEEPASADGFVVSPAQASGTVHADGSTHTFTNTKKSGLVISKTVVSDVPADASRTYTFTVELVGSHINQTFGEGDDAVEFKDGKATVSVQGNGTKAITGLPAGTQYRVTEQEDTNFTSVVTAGYATGTIEAGKTSSVTFKNTRKSGEITIEKSVVSPVPGDDTRDYQFTIQLKDGQDDLDLGGTFKTQGGEDVTFAHGLATVSVRGNGSTTVKNLPAGVGYVVTEVADTNFDSEKVSGDSQGTIPANGNAEVAFKNTRKTGDITIEKSVDSTVPGDDTRDYQFTIQLKDGQDDLDLGGTFKTQGGEDVTFAHGLATVSVRGNGSTTVKNLPAGVGYVVTEVVDTNFDSAIESGNKQGTITAGANAQVAFKNTRKTGELTVSKTVNSTNAQDRQQTFTFTIQLDSAVSGKYQVKDSDEQCEFNNEGKATIELKDGESKTIVGLPHGIAYEVSETSVEGFTTTSANEKGSIAATTNTSFVNTSVKKGNLVVSKSVLSDVQADHSAQYQFTVQLDPPVTGTYKDMTFNNEGLATIWLSDTESAVAEGLPDGTKYTVTEVLDGERNAYMANDNKTHTGTIGHNTIATEEFVNYRESGSLQISKKVVSSIPAEEDAEYWFTLRLGQAISKTYGTGEDAVTFTDGRARVKVVGGETRTISGLPRGITYEVTEEATSHNNMTVDPQNATGTIGEDTNESGVNEVSFTNSHTTTSLEVHKTVDSDVAADHSKDYKFTVTLGDDTINGTFSGVTFENGIGTVTVTGDNSKKIEGLPVGITYSVEEKQESSAGFDVTPSNASGTLGKDQASVVFKNTRNKGELKVQKTVASSTSADQSQNQKFDFTVTLTNNPLDGAKTYGSGEHAIEFDANGVAHFSLAHNEYKLATDMPQGIAYTVEETDANGFTTTYSGKTGTISGTQAVAVVSNARDEGDLTISKNVDSKVVADQTATYQFDITLNPAVSGTYSGVTFTDGVARSVEVQGGTSRVIRGLPKGTTYTVTEVLDEGSNYTVEPAQATGEVGAAGAAVATFTNTRKEGNLSVTKHVTSSTNADTAADTAKEFSFIVTVGAALNGWFGDEETGMEFHDGVARFSLTDGQTKTATGLPAGITYTVTENPDAEFDTTPQNDSGTIVANTTASAVFNNARKEGNLQVEKRVDRAAAGDETKPFTIQVDLHNPRLNNTYGTGDNATEFKSGVATFELAHGQHRLIEGLPVGTTYTVTENPYTDFETTYEGQVGQAITKGDTNTVTVVNTRQYGSFQITKTVLVDGEAPDGLTKSPADGTYTFRITGPGEYAQGKDVTITIENGRAQTKTFDNVLLGEYTVEELANSLDPTKHIQITPHGKQTIAVTTNNTSDIPVARFTNNLKTTSAQLKVTKQFGEYWDSVRWPEGAEEGFSFTLEAVGKAPMPAHALNGKQVRTATKDAKTATFEDIVFTQAGTYEYTIKENLPDDIETDGTYNGITYDTEKHTVTVVVAKPDPEGALKAMVTYDDVAGKKALEIENTYNATGSIHLTGKKSLTGRPLQEGDAWTFEIASNEPDAPMPAVTKVTNSGESIDFGNIAYELKDAREAPYVYTITESGKVDDVNNDTAMTKQVSVSVTDNGDGTLAVSAAQEGQPAFEFTNTYVVTHPLKAEKAIKGRTQWNVGEEYTFELAAIGTADGDSAKKLKECGISTTATTQTNDGKHVADFGTFEFTEKDVGKTFSYRVKESHEGIDPDQSGHYVKDGVTYTTIQYDVTFTVTKDEATQTIQANPEYKLGDKVVDTLEFLNTYTPTPITVELEAKKQLVGRQIAAGDDFRFQLYYVGKNNERLPEYDDDELKTTTRSGDNDTYDEQTKTDQASVKFGNIEIDQAGTRTYIIKEVPPADAEKVTDEQGVEHRVKDGVTYDNTEQTVTIVTTDDGKGNLTAQVNYQNNEVPVFTNTYFGREANISFSKEYYGYDTNAKFDFMLKAVTDDSFKTAREGVEPVYTDAFADDGKALAAKGTNGAFQNGLATVTMPTITYHQKGDYYYVIREAASNDGQKITYDDAAIGVKVHVDDGQNPAVTYYLADDGEHFVQLSGNNARPTMYNNAMVSMSFRSRALRAQAQATSFTNFEPAVSKVLKNGILKGGEFQFAIYEGDSAQGTPLKTAPNDANGKVSFGDFQYGPEDINKPFTYTIVEVKGTDETVAYDDEVIKLSVSVTAGEGGAVVATGTYTQADESGVIKATDNPTFINEYDTIVIHAVKRSREEPYDPLPGAHYGLWMLNPNGEDVYMGLGRNQVDEEGSELVSSDNGDLYYDIPLLEGVAYYFLEEWPPPAGHLVDPYPTDYFTLVHDKENGKFRLVYEADDDFAKYCPGVTR
ncbi:MAG: DUF5979 domain-containing protein [Coriobacteriales bacterium]|nr:DUF5979 domain-containing protein [Coriobacteriales bacterium]